MPSRGAIRRYRFLFFVVFFKSGLGLPILNLRMRIFCMLLPCIVSSVAHRQPRALSLGSHDLSSTTRFASALSREVMLAPMCERNYGLSQPLSAFCYLLLHCIPCRPNRTNHNYHDTATSVICCNKQSGMIIPLHFLHFPHLCFAHFTFRCSLCLFSSSLLVQLFLHFFC